MVYVHPQLLSMGPCTLMCSVNASLVTSVRTPDRSTDWKLQTKVYIIYSNTTQARISPSVANYSCSLHSPQPITALSCGLETSVSQATHAHRVEGPLAPLQSFVLMLVSIAAGKAKPSGFVHRATRLSLV